MEDNLVGTIELMIKWRKARDAYKQLSQGNESEYKKLCSNWQEVIKLCMQKKKIEIIPAILHMVNELEEMKMDVPLGLLAAGYELSNKNDFTI